MLSLSLPFSPSLSNQFQSIQSLTMLAYSLVRSSIYYFNAFSFEHRLRFRFIPLAEIITLAPQHVCKRVFTTVLRIICNTIAHIRALTPIMYLWHTHLARYFLLDDSSDLPVRSMLTKQMQ